MSYNKLAIRQFLYTRCISAYIAYMYSLLGWIRHCHERDHEAYTSNYGDILLHMCYGKPQN